MKQFVELLKKKFNSIEIDKDSKDIHFFSDEKDELFDSSSELSKEFFNEQKNSYFLPLSDTIKSMKWIGRVKFSVIENKVILAPINWIKIEEVFEGEDFEDLYYIIWSKKAILSKNKKQYKIIEDIDEEGAIKSGIFSDKNFAAFEINKDGKESSFRIAHDENFYTVRKLWKIFSFIDVYWDDEILLRLFTRILNMDTSNKSILVSWSTGSWKTTLLIAFLQFLNIYTAQDLIKFIIYKTINNKLMEWISISFEKFKEKDLEVIQEELVSFYKLKKEEVDSILDWINSYCESNWLDKLLENYEWGVVFSIEKPIEKKFTSDKMLFLQNSAEFESSNSKDVKEFENWKTLDDIRLKKFLTAAEVALQSNPKIMYVSELKRDEEFKKWLDIIVTWFPVLASNHSWDIFQNLERILWIDMNNEKSLKNKIISWLGGLLNLKRYNTWSWRFLISYEYLIFEKDISKHLVNNSIEQFKHLIQTAGLSLKQEYISHEISLISNLYKIFLKNQEYERIKEFNEEDIMNLFSPFNLSTVSQTYSYDVQKITNFAKNYIENVYSE